MLKILPIVWSLQNFLNVSCQFTYWETKKTYFSKIFPNANQILHCKHVFALLIGQKIT